ncbi:cytidine deaminase : Cytidine deaminase OS=Solibacter usitatus (strain Ellin6076) GN=Acid_5234 PE=4 SV=1: dCMP_cyt_deam_1 [Gemmataceae bacterium]|nr:cytidine deaminase : Cytidine deaminase OS=Solibacter usitatus (strain Ellin6076) GN=Acid_5234 PE=4 SV=1: dCMP_cyt_deam_1 [Gemmataceae bacterium]VTU01249.1 cytidine deaminase : Cytidine deaminase OS=Solibacter usitatus (strain Ellin6076) GN=Acid_5234 PE=4 SV=1: dCMP_cyt_deam_1 [Gemmataceae bacterium]
MTDPLVTAATEARERAFAPYSKFRVGAALEAEDGTVIAGCNVESASYGLTTCAERVAVFTGVARGFRCFKRVAIVADTAALTPPCGACRQILWEFAPDAEVILANLTGRTERFTVRELLPRGFDAKQLAREEY